MGERSTHTGQEEGEEEVGIGGSYKEQLGHKGRDRNEPCHK